MQVNYCGISGGKDSTATALWLIHESGLPKDSLCFTFCNTHNEHELTYQYIRNLSAQFIKWGAPEIAWLEPELGFYDLAKKHGRFPSRKARFCTQFLKVIPTRNDITALHKLGHDVVLYSGVRWAESADRAKLPTEEFDDGFGCYVKRPIITWSTEQVFSYLTSYGVPRNPLYDYGASRVGCFPCINSNKTEIRIIAEQFPERIDEIRRWETTLNDGTKRAGRFASFFVPKTVPLRFRSKAWWYDKEQRWINLATIDDVVGWSKTDRGGRQYPLRFDQGLVCESGKGMCE